MGYNWKKLKNAEVFGRGQYFKEGDFKLKLLKMYTIKTRKKGEALIVDFEVMESTCDEIPVGQTRNWYQSLQDEDVAFPAIKDFLFNLFGVDQGNSEEVEEFEANMEGLMVEAADGEFQKKDAEDHPLNGKTVAVSCYMKETSSNKEFTVHKWAPWDGED